MRTGRGSDGQLFRQIYELPLTRSQFPLFTLTWTLMHSIGTASPLLGYDAARLIEGDVHVPVSVEGYDSALATTTLQYALRRDALR